MAHAQMQHDRSQEDGAAQALAADRRLGRGREPAERRAVATPAPAAGDFRLSPDPLQGTDRYRLATPIELWL
jgi:hypothetical protein